MRARSWARPWESPSEMEALLCSSEGSLLLSITNSRDSEAPSLPGQPRHLLAELADMFTASIAGDALGRTRLTILNTFIQVSST